MPTPTELYDQIRRMSFDVDEKLSSEAELYYYMSEGELELAKIVECTETTTTDTSVVDQREYDRPSGAIKIQRVTWNTVKLKKIPISDVDVIEGQSYGGITSIGNVIYYYEYGSKIGLSPLPNAAEEIKYWYLKYPTDLNSSSTSFTIPEEYANVLTDWCLYRMLTKDDQRGMADRYFQSWQLRLKLTNDDWIRRKEIDENEVVHLEDIYPTSEMGLI